MQTKIVIFDFDGTLTVSKSSTWLRIWKKVDALDIDKDLYNRYYNGEFDYNTWLELGFNEFKKRNYSKTDLQELILNMKLLNDVKFVFEYLNKKGIKIYILSGGLKCVIKEVVKDLNSLITNIEASDFLFDESGKLDRFVPPFLNPENKQEYVNYIIQTEKVNPKQILFVGNGKNDETVYLTNVNTLCLNPDDADFNNKEIWHNVVETKTLKDILPFISCQN